MASVLKGKQEKEKEKEKKGKKKKKKRRLNKKAADFTSCEIWAKLSNFTYEQINELINEMLY